MSSDKQKVAKKKGQGTAMSSFLVVAAVAAAGGIGHFLWKFQSRLDRETPEPVTVVAEGFPETVEVKPREASLSQVTELLPVTPPAPAPAPKPVKPVRGDITIVGKNGTTASIAPPTPEDLAAASRNSSSNYPTANNYGPGPQVYTPDDPNRYLPRPSYRSGRPRYYDYESGRSRSNEYDPTFQRRTTVRQSNTVSGGN